MRPTILLALALLCAAGCKGPDVSLGNMCWDGCGGGEGGAGGYENLTIDYIIGFPRARVDTAGPLTPSGQYYGRLHVGDSVTLYMVRQRLDGSPCAGGDTLRSVTWSVLDTSVFRARSDSGGRGAIRALTPGQSLIFATTPPYGTVTQYWQTSTMYACDGTRGTYIAMVRVDSATAP